MELLEKSQRIYPQFKKASSRDPCLSSATSFQKSPNSQQNPGIDLVQKPQWILQPPYISLAQKLPKSTTTHTFRCFERGEWNLNECVPCPKSLFYDCMLFSSKTIFREALCTILPLLWTCFKDLNKYIQYLKVVTNSLCFSPPKSTSTWLYAPARRRLLRIRVQSLEEACSFSSYSHRYTQGEEETLKSTEAGLMCRCGGRFKTLLSSVHAAELEEAKLKRLHKFCDVSLLFASIYLGPGGDIKRDAVEEHVPHFKNCYTKIHAVELRVGQKAFPDLIMSLSSLHIDMTGMIWRD